MKKFKFILTAIVVTAIAALTLFAACTKERNGNDGGVKPVTSTSDVNVVGKTFRFSSIDCEDATVKSKYEAAFEDLCLIFIDGETVKIDAKDEAYDTEASYEVVCYAVGNECGVQIKDLGLTVNKCYIGTSLTYYTDGSLRCRLTANSTEMTQYFTEVK